MYRQTQLAADEQAAIAESRKIRFSQDDSLQSIDKNPLKAICLSGGGVRSATFATGIFNRWAQQQGAILRKFDYLSTVSGGGYFGAFYGRLFLGDVTNPAAHTKKTAEQTGPTNEQPATDHKAKVEALYNNLASSNSQPIKYLKRNGRYLANSGDENWLAAATLIRNLLWLHILLALVLFPVFSFLHYFQSVQEFYPYAIVRPKDLWFGWPLIYWIAAAFAVGFVGLVCAYFVFAVGWLQSYRRKLTKWQSRCLMYFVIALSAGGICSASVMLLHQTTDGAAGVTESLPFFLALYSGIVGLSATIFRIQAKIQQIIGVSFNPKTLLLVVAIVAVIVYLLTVSAMTFIVMELLYQNPIMVPASSQFQFEFNLLLIAVCCLIAGVVLSSFGSPINYTSLHYFYAARLRRAFLGGANPRRFNGMIKKEAAEEEVGDDVTDLRDYTPYKFGGPFHLINVTLNSSRSPNGNLWWPDCKGFNLALSALAFNFAHDKVQYWSPQPNDSVAHGNNTAVQQLGPLHRREIPNLGSAIAISGAAASTGMGQLSTLAGGILTALFNIRTGYWWHYKCRFSSFYSLYLAELLNNFKIKELIDSKKDQAQQQSHWYLSDGGHFENLAVYEMIRRRVPRIVAIDAAGDERFQFEDLTNLIRRARLDFQCDLTIASTAQIDDLLGAECSKVIGTLDDLKPAQPDPLWHNTASTTKRAVLLRGTLPATDSPVAPETDKVATAIPASEIWILYIKPTLTRQESPDILRYQLDHPDFPHQSTADQFFDEAQWESYRKLGEITADELAAAVTEFLS
jgi:hypothetical protein